jgi:hypothetical protein
VDKQRRIELEKKLNTERSRSVFSVLSSAILQYVFVEKIDPSKIDNDIFKFNIDLKRGGIRFDVPIPFMNGNVDNIISSYNNEMVKFLALYMKAGNKISVVSNRRMFLIAKNEIAISVNFVKRFTPKEFEELVNGYKYLKKPDFV